MSSFLEKFNNEDESISNGIISSDSVIEEDTSFYDRQKKHKIIKIVVLTIIIIVIIILIILSKLVKVPNFENGLSTVAVKWGSNNNINITLEEKYNNNIAEGIVISQSIKEGSRIFKGNQINIVVSKGSDPSELIEVPNLNETTIYDIKTWKEENGLNNVTIKEEYSKEVEEGKIISYEFEDISTNETNFKRSDKLTIIVSKGKQQLTMDDFTTKTKNDVNSWCSKNSVKCKIKESFSKDIDSGIVISQSIAKDSVIENNTEITFVISLGEGVTIPNYSNISSEDASLVNEKVKVKIKQVYDMKVPYGKLISQSVKAGTTKSIDNSDVTLTYSLGVPYFNSLVGTSESEIAKIFYEYNQKGVNFSYTIKYVDSEEEKGKIVWTSKANEFVTMNEKIEIQVSNGSKYKKNENVDG